MDLQQILGMLDHVSGPNSSGEYTARCPAHQDRTASLTVTAKDSPRDGRKRIYLCCHAGCGNDAVMAALGITAKDLIVNPDPARPAARSQRGGRSAAKPQRRDEPTDADAPEEARTVWGPDEYAMDPETGEITRDPNGNPYRVRTVDENGRPLHPKTGEPLQMDDQGRWLDPKTGKPLQAETVGGITVYTVGNGAGNASSGKGSGKSQGKPGAQAGQGSAGRESAVGGASGSVGKDAEKDQLRPDWEHPDAVYSYTDEDGKELFQVVRLHYLDGKPGKTFRQRRYDPADPKANRAGFVNSVPSEIRDSTLYRMPQVAKAISEGKPVIVVEGEKDVETLERLGHVATCNPGGAGKWRDGYSRILAGADVIILPDNDSRGNGYTGQNHAYDVALKLQGIAKRVRLVDLKEACAELPEKGDISDMVAIMGDVDAMDALARQVAATRDFDPNAVPFWLTPMEQAERLYAAVKGYGVSGGCIAQETGNESKALCDFVVIPRMELTRDDGVNTSLNFVLDGWNQHGRKLGRVTIRAAELDNMNWVTEKWGFDASLAPGSTTKSKVAWAIKKVGQMTAKRVTEYNHTGWRKIGGKWCYLYHGGAVGMDGITVDMGDALKTYRLDGGGVPGFDRITFPEAAKISLRLKDVMKEEIGIALLGTAYLAPLREFLGATDIQPAFALFLYGESGTHKTTAAALAMSHFGNFHAKNAPASFNDTGNQIRKKAFLVKDAPILVDDFHPVTSVQEKRQMAATAQTLSRAFGDGVERGRLNADRTLQANTPPRSVAIITGEDLPAIGASGLARYFILDIDKGDIPVGDELTEMQELARRGYLQKAMRGYILWLLKQADGMPERLHKMFLQYREDIRKDSSGQHDRAPETVACILIGYNLMLNYMRDLGLFDTDTAIELLKDARHRLMESSRKQARDMESEKPTRIFLDALGELLNSKRAALKDLSLGPDQKQTFGPAEKMIGYMDSEYYYLLPNVSFGEVAKLCREQGQEFPVSLKALYKHLRTDGILKGISKEENPTRQKWIDGKNIRLLWIPASEMRGGPKPGAEQQMMDVSGEELPDEWK